MTTLVKEVEGLRQIVEDMTEKVTGLRLEDKIVEDMMEKVTGLRLEDNGVETESRVTKTGANQESEEAAGNFRTEEMITCVEDEEEIRTEERKEICSGETLMATHAYTRNPESPLGQEIDLQQWDTLLQGRTRRARTLETSRRQEWASGIRTSGVPGGHPRHDSRGRGKRRHQEVTREQDRGKSDWRMDWTGGRTKEELFSGTDRWHQEKL